MDTSNLIIGVNGSIAFNEEGAGKLVALFTSLVRGLNSTYIEKTITELLLNDSKCLEDLIVMAFQTRDVRGGKGERDLLYHMFITLAKHLIDTDKEQMLKSLINLIAEYGCYRDLIAIIKLTDNYELFCLIQTEIILTVRKDLAILDSDAEHKSISLLGKWLPRESGADKKIARRIAKQARMKMPEYRKIVSRLNKHLKTVEINMCGGTWRDIVPDAVPGRNMHIHKKAFLNEIVRRRGQPYRPVDELRCPTSEDRLECRKKFIEYLGRVKEGKVTMKGGDVLMPHEVIKEALALTRNAPSESEKTAIEGQWKAIKEKTGKFNRIVPLSDFSGSMEGIPLLVSMAIGLLIAETTDGAFRNKLITFDTNPELLSFSEDADLFKKTYQCSTARWGGSTNFEKAYELVLETLIENKVPVGEEPKDLLVLTDMGWNQATSGHPFHLDNLKKKFREAGGWEVPRVIIWNLREQFKQYQATEKTPGVVVISGWHPSVIKRIRDGVNITTPYDGLRAVLDDERYDAVREAVRSMA